MVLEEAVSTEKCKYEQVKSYHHSSQEELSFEGVWLVYCIGEAGWSGRTGEIK